MIARATVAVSLGLAALACSGSNVAPPVETVPGLAGTVVVPNKQTSTVTIVDVASGERLATIPVGPQPHEIALDADGATAVTTAMDGSTLSVIDIGARRVVRTIDLAADSLTHGIAFLAGDSVVAVTSAATNRVVLVDVLRGNVLGSVATAGGRPHILQAIANGSRVYTSEADAGTISEFDAVRGTHTRTFHVPDAPEGMNVTPDGSEVWVGTSTFFTGRVIVLDPRSGAVSEIVKMFGWPYRIHLTPDARTVLVPDLRRSTLRFIDRASRREVGRLGQRRVVGNLVVGDTPDGIAYTPRVFVSAP